MGCRRVIAVLALSFVALDASAQHGAPQAGEWRTYGGDLGNTRYSPLEQIDATNFNKLEVAWRFKADNLGPTKEYTFQSTPLMVDGVVYSTAGSRRAVVDLKQNDDQDIDPLNGEIGLHAAPVVAKDVIIVGAAHRTGANPKSMRNVKGYVRAFDVRTGKRLWIFHTIPTKGEFGTESWLQGSAEYTGNTGVWGQISVDEDLETVYLPVEEATGDYFGANRPGDNLFGESLVAVDL